MNNKWVAIFGKLLIAVIFLISGYGKITNWSATAALIGSKGVPLPQIALIIVVLVEIGGGLVLLVGPFEKWAALVLFLYLIPITLVIHPVWGIPQEQLQSAAVQFLKNVAIMGGLLQIVARPQP
ncbi:MAG TPA: DoxX family protein [Bryobacteraceae bacterium]|nr:DoxX family protein [Bryobacteraceae bacterium]